MNTLHFSTLLAALGSASLALAQVQQQTPDPRSSTSQVEGTAADRTPPNPTATRPVRPGEESLNQQVDPRPSTSQAEGTAADRTPPGRISTTKTTTTGSRSELVGAAVVSPSGASLGKVVDVVFDSVAQPTFVVIASENGAAAVPYSVASTMKSEGRVVIDPARLESAPKVRQGEWRADSGSHWQEDATRYWQKGGGLF